MILSGDTVCWGHKIHNEVLYKKFFDFVSRQFPVVLVIPSNHEYYYGAEFNQTNSELKDFLSEWKNVHLLLNSHHCVLDINSKPVVFIGATLWTSFVGGNLNVIKAVMNDFRKIRVNDHKITPSFMMLEHEQAVLEVEKIYKEVSEKHDKIVVFTHHAPSFLSVDPEYAGDEVNSAYASDLEEWIQAHPKITNWIHGHMHTRLQYQIGDCTVGVNAFGYPGSQKIDSGLRYFDV